MLILHLHRALYISESGIPAGLNTQMFETRDAKVQRKAKVLLY